MPKPNEIGVPLVQESAPKPGMQCELGVQPSVSVIWEVVSVVDCGRRAAPTMRAKTVEVDGALWWVRIERAGVLYCFL